MRACHHLDGRPCRGVNRVEGRLAAASVEYVSEGDTHTAPVGRTSLQMRTLGRGCVSDARSLARFARGVQDGHIFDLDSPGEGRHAQPEKSLLPGISSHLY